MITSIKNIMISLLITVIVGLFFRLGKKEIIKKEYETLQNNFTVRPSSIFLIIGIIGLIFTLLLIALMYTFPNDTASIWIALIFGIGSLLGLWLIVYYFTYRIIFINSKLIVYCFFKKNENQLSAITSAKLIGSEESISYELKLFIDNKRIVTLNSLCFGFNSAIKKIEELGIEIKKQKYNTFKDIVE